MTDVLLTADELAERLASPRPPVVLDVRWRLDRPDGRPAYREGHIPGAVYVDLDHELADHDAPATAGRHPLPSREQLQAAAHRWGLDDGDQVVVYDDLAGMSAARAWWLLADAGVSDVRILDGGLRAWTDGGRPLETGDVVPEPGSVTLGRGALPVLDIADAAAFPAHGVLLDVRAAERYRGEVEPIDPRAGHIPGAVSLPTTGNVDAEGRFLAPDALRERFRAAGIEDGGEVAVYCGSGITASHAAAALALAGFTPRLYAGSWSQWSQHPERPVATGPLPG